MTRFPPIHRFFNWATADFFFDCHAYSQEYNQPLVEIKDVRVNIGSLNLQHGTKYTAQGSVKRWFWFNLHSTVTYYTEKRMKYSKQILEKSEELTGLNENLVEIRSLIEEQKRLGRNYEENELKLEETILTVKQNIEQLNDEYFTEDDLSLFLFEPKAEEFQQTQDPEAEEGRKENFFKKAILIYIK